MVSNFCRSLCRAGPYGCTQMWNRALAPRPGGRQTHACSESPSPLGHPKTEQLSSCSEMYSGPNEDGLCPAWPRLWGRHLGRTFKGLGRDALSACWAAGWKGELLAGFSTPAVTNRTWPRQHTHLLIHWEEIKQLGKRNLSRKKQHWRGSSAWLKCRHGSTWSSELQMSQRVGSRRYPCDDPATCALLGSQTLLPCWTPKKSQIPI